MPVYELRKEIEDLARDIILEIYNHIQTQGCDLDKKKVEKLRNSLTKKHKLTPPRNIELLAAYNVLISEDKIIPSEEVLSFIVKRKVRSESGISNITVLMKEFTCPGKCIFCPTQPGMPKSYFSTQPAMLRAVRNEFNAYKQVKTRLNGLQTQGHDTTKIDIRTAGGTWSSYPLVYQEYFVKSIYFALNEGPGEFTDHNTAEKMINEMTLEQLIKINETAESRCVGLWVETRPDWVTPEEIARLRRFGVTGIELGIQTTDDKVNEFNKRGHGLAESIKATQMCRDAGLKICHHIMPNLPRSTIESDMQTVHDLFEKGILNPDYIKVYPCVVTPYTELGEMMKTDPTIYVPYSDDQLAEIIVKIKSLVPEYCRIIRILRDFPSDIILSGTHTLNMRQILQNRGVTCRCIRCREIRGDSFNAINIKLVTRKYMANEAEEIFLSYEDAIKDKIIALLRLRLNKSWPENIPEIHGAALVRELHVYGTQKSMTNSNTLKSKTQHIGFGKKLMQEAEKLALKAGYESIAVIAAVGTREYYRKLGYEIKGTYMVKELH